jgi:CYTH domain-containing protein
MEVNNKNIVEQSRAEVHTQDNEHFIDRQESADEIHHQDQMQVADIAIALENHIKDNKEQFAITKETGRVNRDNIEKLIPLAALAPLIETMVEERRAYTLVASKIIYAIGVMGAMAGLIYATIKIYQELWHK